MFRKLMILYLLYFFSGQFLLRVHVLLISDDFNMGCDRTKRASAFALKNDFGAFYLFSIDRGFFLVISRVWSSAAKHN